MLYVDESNPAAIRLYEGLGFTRWDIDVMYRDKGRAGNERTPVGVVPTGVPRRLPDHQAIHAGPRRTGFTPDPMRVGPHGYSIIQWSAK